MTLTDKMAMLRVLLGSGAEQPPGDVLEVLLKFAETEILAWMYRSYPSLPDGVEGVPREYEMIQIHAALIGYNMLGVEGQNSHSENGVSRQYAYSDMAAFIHRNVTPLAYVL